MQSASSLGFITISSYYTLKTLGYTVSLVVHEYGGVGFPEHMRVCQRLSPAQVEAGGERLDCVSSPPLVFIIPQGSLVTMATWLTGCQVQNNIFPSKKFCWDHPSWQEGNEGSWVCTAVSASQKSQEPQSALHTSTSGMTSSKTRDFVIKWPVW